MAARKFPIPSPGRATSYSLGVSPRNLANIATTMKVQEQEELEQRLDESGYDEETWPELKVALDRDRLSKRKLFDE